MTTFTSGATPWCFLWLPGRQRSKGADSTRDWDSEKGSRLCSGVKVQHALATLHWMGDSLERLCPAEPFLHPAKRASRGVTLTAVPGSALQLPVHKPSQLKGRQEDVRKQLSEKRELSRPSKLSASPEHFGVSCEQDFLSSSTDV